MWAWGRVYECARPPREEDDRRETRGRDGTVRPEQKGSGEESTNPVL